MSHSTRKKANLCSLAFCFEKWSKKVFWGSSPPNHAFFPPFHFEWAIEKSRIAIGTASLRRFLHELPSLGTARKKSPVIFRLKYSPLAVASQLMQSSQICILAANLSSVLFLNDPQLQCFPANKLEELFLVSWWFRTHNKFWVEELEFKRVRWKYISGQTSWCWAAIQEVLHLNNLIKYEMKLSENGQQHLTRLPLLFLLVYSTHHFWELIYFRFLGAFTFCSSQE